MSKNQELVIIISALSGSLDCLYELLALDLLDSGRRVEVLALIGLVESVLSKLEQKQNG